MPASQKFLLPKLFGMMPADNGHSAPTTNVYIRRRRGVRTIDRSTKEFENVEVTPHNLRNDVFRHNVTTAIDVVMSLGDQRKITYELKWYESIGTAGIVKDYWVEAIDDDKAHDRCGFVYEAGSPKYEFYRGNHIHLPSDIRVLNSPEYVEFFWVCI